MINNIDIEKIEKHKKKCFDRLRKLKKATSDENVEVLKKFLIEINSRKDSKYGAGVYLTGIELTLDNLLETYNDINNRLNIPIKYIKKDKGQNDCKT